MRVWGREEEYTQEWKKGRRGGGRDQMGAGGKMAWWWEGKAGRWGGGMGHGRCRQARQPPLSTGQAGSSIETQIQENTQPPLHEHNHTAVVVGTHPGRESTIIRERYGRSGGSKGGRTQAGRQEGGGTCKGHGGVVVVVRTAKAGQARTKNQNPTTSKAQEKGIRREGEGEGKKGKGSKSNCKG